MLCDRSWIFEPSSSLAPISPSINGSIAVHHQSAL
jgi:hypothetical protein